MSRIFPRLDLTFEAIGEALGTSKRTVLRWRSGEAAPRRKNEERLARLDELRFWLLEVFGEDQEAADVWIGTRIRDLDGKTPQEAILGGDVEQVIELLATYEPRISDSRLSPTCASCGSDAGKTGSMTT